VRCSTGSPPQPDLDASRVVVSGGSYGGYMVLASLVHYSDRLAAGVKRVGISNFVSFLTNTEDYRRDLRRAEYGDERDPVMRAFLERISPLNNVDRIRRPLLIIQGANDPRVPASESEQIYRRCWPRRCPGLVRAGPGRRPRLSQEAQQRLRRRGHGAVPAAIRSR
jgi:acetyl esterase/lipase